MNFLTQAKPGRKDREMKAMSKFIYVFEQKAAKDFRKRGYELLKYDEKNDIWVFINKEPDNPESLEFTTKYQVVLSDVVSF